MTLAGAATSLLQQYGWVALFVLLALETAMLLRFVPSELILGVGAVALVRSPLTFALVVADAALAMTAGSVLLFLACAYGGRAFLLRHPRWFHLTRERLDKLDALYRRPAGELTVAWTRALPIVRTWASIPAGIARMDLPRFIVLSFVGHVVFAVWVSWAAISPVGQRIVSATEGWIRAGWPLLALVAAIAIALAAWLWWRRAPSEA